MTEADTSLAEIVRGLPRILLYAIFMTPTPASEGPQTAHGAETPRQHLLYLFRLEAERKLFASGPLDLTPGAPTIEGMCIIAVDSIEEAQSIAAAEPNQRAGMRSNHVRSWQLNEGAAVATARDLTNRPWARSSSQAAGGFRWPG